MHLSSLKYVTVFMRASKLDEEVAQLNTIYRCQLVCKNTDLTPVTTGVVFSMIKSAKLTLEGQKTILLIFGNKEWPQEWKQCAASYCTVCDIV